MQSISVGKRGEVPGVQSQDEFGNPNGRIASLTMKEGDYNFNDTAMAQHGLQLMAEKVQPVIYGNLHLQKEISVLAQGKNFHKTMEASLGLTAAFCKLNVPRVLRVSVETGMPQDGHSQAPYREVMLHQPIVSYSMFKNDDGTARFICIGCTNKTVYMIIRKELAYSFIIDMSSLTAKEAVKNLYISNLNKGPVVFGKTSRLLNSFFDRLFPAVYTEPTILNFEAKHISGDTVTVKLYFDPIDQSNNMLSVNGYVFDVELNEFPSKQINRGYNIKKKDVERKASK